MEICSIPKLVPKIVNRIFHGIYQWPGPASRYKGSLVPPNCLHRLTEHSLSAHFLITKVNCVLDSSIKLSVQVTNLEYVLIFDRATASFWQLASRHALGLLRAHTRTYGIIHDIRGFLASDIQFHIDV